MFASPLERLHGRLVRPPVHERLRGGLLGAAVVWLYLQLAITALTTALSQGSLGVLAWRSVYIGNALGWAATIGYILHWHPEIRTEFAHAED